MMKIAVIGAGQMGNGIAQVAASAGYEVLMIDIKEEYVDRVFFLISSFKMFFI